MTFAPALSSLLDTLRSHGYSSEAAAQALGPNGLAAAHSGNPAGALFALARSTSPHATLVSAVYLRQPQPRAWWEELCGQQLMDELSSVGVLNTRADGSLVLEIDVRPLHVPFHGAEDVLISSDPDASVEIHQPGPHHVPGVGHAPLSLLSSVPPLPSGSPCSVLDLGTGSGALSLVLAANYPHAEITGTDIHARALEFARANDLGSRVEWLEGSWFEPVAGRTFDRIISNPPFVIGPAVDVTEEGHIYRDSGLALDAASRLVVEGAAEHLNEGGRAHILVGWAITDASAPPAPVQWIADTGIRALLVHRDQVDVFTYVHTWLEDESIDPRSEQGRQRTTAWLEFFADHGVTHIGLGYMHMERSRDLQGEPSEVHVELLDQPLPPDTHLGAEVDEWFRRMAWLARLDAPAAVLDHQFAVRPGVAVDQVFVGDAATGQGFLPYSRSLSRTEGPCYKHDIDGHVQAIVAGLHPEGLTMRDVVELYATVQGIDEQECAEACIPIAVDLVRHGIILPLEVLE
ncbi:MAG TPA: methyltransferase [Candidatus Corynebacterium gallistercoris]|uniref:Methyltransferase n=1 Tax=Candidatus Corynebacterium gallistercoris TaxID=2838530 RepID=A0A9D1UPW4_9CORY|nr:methyltransferase [Candidatus Corynebacterium gallistercoris]